MWALLAPAVIMGVWRLVTGGGQRVDVVGSGQLEVLRAEDAPEGARVLLRVVPDESAETTARRVRERIGSYPDILMFGSPAFAKSEIDSLTQEAENAAAVPIVVLDSSDEELRTWFRNDFCSAAQYRVCVELGDAVDPADARGRLAGAVRDALGRMNAMRAATQVGSIARRARGAV